VRELIVEASETLAGSTTPLLDAEVLAAHLTGKNRSWFYAHPEERLQPEYAKAFRDLVERRAAGEPIALITGTREFWSLTLEVTGDVLIPRPETELLVELVLRHLPRDSACRIADLGTGSGAIALALATELPETFIVAVESSGPALDVARRNAQRLGIEHDRVEFRAGDWFESLSNERFDCLVSNPPYVRDEDPHLQRGDVRFEPRGALAAGPDGLDAIRRIVTHAPDYLSAGGVLILEHGHDQQTAVMELLHDAGASVDPHADLGGVPRAVVARFR
jgi:release factor glutamine methyltransferase